MGEYMAAYEADLAAEVAVRGEILCHDPEYPERVVQLVEVDVQYAAVSNPEWIYFFAVE